MRVMAQVSSKKRLMQELSDIGAGHLKLDAPRVLDALQERESLGPTGVGHGVALPHARIEGVQKVHGIFIKLEKPIDFDSVDRQPVDLVFCLFAPIDSGVDHLKALALVSRTLRDPAICAKLRVNSDPTTLYTILTEAQRIKAA